MKFNFSKEFYAAMAELEPDCDITVGTGGGTFGEFVAGLLRSAYKEGWQNAIDAEFVGDEAENAAFNQSTTLAQCLGFEQGEYEPEPLPAAQGVPEGLVLKVKEDALTVFTGSCNSTIDAIEYMANALLQSTPTEPQATVELTDEDESVVTALRYARFIASEINSEESRQPVQDIDGEYWPTRLHSLCERALNQRQAVKPLSTAQGVPEGWRLVPIEPTCEMLDEGMEVLRKRHGRSVCEGFTYGDSRDCYKAMLFAAPEQAESKEGKP